VLVMSNFWALKQHHKKTILAKKIMRKAPVYSLSTIIKLEKWKKKKLPYWEFKQELHV
jgi:hypothetical protein